MKKTLTLYMLLFMVLLNGCSMSSLFFNAKSEDPVVLIDNPPMRMVYAGKFNDEDRKMFVWMLRQMDKMPYKDHTYNFPIGANISINEGDTTSHSSSFTGSASRTYAPPPIDSKIYKVD